MHERMNDMGQALVATVHIFEESGTFFVILSSWGPILQNLKMVELISHKELQEDCDDNMHILFYYKCIHG